METRVADLGFQIINQWFRIKEPNVNDKVNRNDNDNDIDNEKVNVNCQYKS